VRSLEGQGSGNPAQTGPEPKADLSTNQKNIMVYRFVIRDGNAVRIGAVDCAELETKLQEYRDNGYAICEAEVYDAQILKGKEPEIVVMPVAEAPVEAPVEVPAEEQKSSEAPPAAE
jgi:hypothetical protein